MGKNTIRLNEIYNEDCLDGLNRIPDGFVDLVCTDPSYCIGTTSNGKKGTWTDNCLIRPFFTKLFSELHRVCRDGAQIYINTDWRTYPLLFPILHDFFNIKNLIVWDYEWIKAGSHYRFSHEFIIYAVKGDVQRTFARNERDVWRIRPINFTSKEKLHRAQKPLELTDRIILNSSNEGDVVLDCFMGSGTTAVSCMRHRRHFIGYEIDYRQWMIAKRRIDEEQKTDMT